MGPILNETKLYRRQQVCFELLSQVPLLTFAFSPCRTRIFVRDAFARLLNWTGTLEAFFFHKCNHGYDLEGRVSGHNGTCLFRCFVGRGGVGRVKASSHEYTKNISVCIECENTCRSCTKSNNIDCKPMNIYEISERITYSRDVLQTVSLCKL